MSIFINGFLMGLSLIIAIGPQNALLIRQGIARVGVTAVIIICLLSDVLLILGGTAGVGVLVERAPIVLIALKWFGFFYLLYFAASCFKDAWKPRTLPTDSGSKQTEISPSNSFDQVAPDQSATSSNVKVKQRTTVSQQKIQPDWKKPALAAIVMTWLNPAAYLDTLVMLGNLANQHGLTGRWYFAAGALAASFIWFPTIGYGAAKLATPLSNPQTWRIVNAIIGVVMIGIAVRLILH
ncbi:LysE/ArgO family amino acid transporter [Corynebacterium freiburgense]|uniref:LysE/ArgO family amino acid transporter n=1 Tax=Corynebacterium freiburgense TaxID=556548 RepID=UPI000406A84A|nr:LysE/ArgO family amino acid transporter [Corynebacterium freiburgense]WJZ02432.1 Arginine exporter protein ArgO [Corynebacterium freiburgense]